ncbi:MAG TPA: ABC transporter ATP-binding protein, partial [Candidatus Hydrogenedentes bacterium]|nr:ABC transporter ATP-binding protein [Candidatus Hydrogenedentota bacterium]
MSAIETHSLTKVYRTHVGRAGIRALDGLDIEVRANEIYGFVGQNGAGKT